MSSIRLSPEDRHTLLQQSRAADPGGRLHAHILRLPFSDHQPMEAAVRR